jgi:hypothetical protein
LDYRLKTSNLQQKLMKTRKSILLALALLSAVVAYAQPSTRIDLTQLVGPADTSKVNFVITEGDTAYYEYQVPSLSFDITTEEDAVPGMLTWNTDERTKQAAQSMMGR